MKTDCTSFLSLTLFCGKSLPVSVYKSHGAVALTICATLWVDPSFLIQTTIHVNHFCRNVKCCNSFGFLDPGRTHTGIRCLDCSQCIPARHTHDSGLKTHTHTLLSNRKSTVRVGTAVTDKQDYCSRSSHRWDIVTVLQVKVSLKLVR